MARDRGKRMAGSSRLMLVVAVVILLPDVAVAEVCDKEVPDWRPGDGPVGTVEGVMQFIGSPGGILTFTVVAAACAVRGIWIPVFAGCYLVAVTWLLGAPWIGSDGWDRIYQASVAEGCRASPESVLGFTALLAIAMFSLAARRVWFRRLSG
jgi:hypothetical protein